MKDAYIKKEPTVMVLIMTAQTPPKALLLEHRRHKRWMPPGGHQDPWENPLETAIREVKEETGVDITPYMPKVQVVNDFAQIIPAPKRIVEVKIPAKNDEPEHYHIDQLYIVKVPKVFDVVKDDSETDKFGWFTLEEMRDIYIPPDVRLVLEQELKP